MTYNTNPNKKKDDETVRDKINSAYDKFKHNEKVDELQEYLKEHWRETLSYVILIFGLIILFVNSSFGGILIGVVLGISFSDEIITFFKRLWNDLKNAHNPSKPIILIGVLIAFFICAPMIYIGAAAAVIARKIIV